MRELIEVDGKLYDENFDVVRRVTVDDVTFTEGEQYENHFGECVVLKLYEKDMKVRYISSKGHGVASGTISVYPIKSQAETINNEKKRKQTANRRATTIQFSEIRDVNITDYIREYGCIVAEVPQHKKDSFDEQFFSVTGHRPDDHRSGYRIEENPNWWGVSFRVFFPMSDAVERMDIPKKGLSVRDGMVRISNNEFAWGLLSAGLELGSKSGIGNGFAFSS